MVRPSKATTHSYIYFSKNVGEEVQYSPFQATDICLKFGKEYGI